MTWYPSKPTEEQIRRRIMRECWKEGYNVKQIAGYFKLSLCSVYDKINIRGMKLKMREEKLG